MNLDLFKQFSVVSMDRLIQIEHWVRLASTLDGDMAELGTYRGGTAMLLASFGKVTHVFDTFSGIPNADATVDKHVNADVGDVESRLMAYSPLIRIHKGVFPATTVGLEESRFCCAYFDADTRQSCLDFLAFFWPRLTKGGVLIFDDYEWGMCPGAVKSFKHGRLIKTAPMQCVIIKE